MSAVILVLVVAVALVIASSLVRLRARCLPLVEQELARQIADRAIQSGSDPADVALWLASLPASRAAGVPPAPLPHPRKP